jgi:hypothetical protein
MVHDSSVSAGVLTSDPSDLGAGQVRNLAESHRLAGSTRSVGGNSTTTEDRGRSASPTGYVGAPPSRADLLVASLTRSLEPYLGFPVAGERARNLATATLGVEEGFARENAVAIAKDGLSAEIPTIADLMREGRLYERTRVAAMVCATNELAAYLGGAS